MLAIVVISKSLEIRAFATPAFIGMHLAGGGHSARYVSTLAAMHRVVVLRYQEMGGL